VEDDISLRRGFGGIEVQGRRKEVCMRGGRRGRNGRRVRIGVESNASPTNASTPGAVKNGDDLRLRDLLDLGPLLVLRVAFVDGVNDTFNEIVCFA
jgi:hypothetical protein